MSDYTILVVDDESAQHEILDEHLRLAGYRRRHAINGADALKTVAEEKPDLILMDVQMPVMDGFETLTAMRDKLGITDIPVLFLSNFSQNELKIKGLDLGADDYITKPFNSTELISRIRAALRRAGCRRPAQGAMAGDLTDIGLSDLLQTMELGSKTAHIRLNDINGEIFIRKGMLVHARLGSASGKSALERIFFLEKGRFSITFNQLPDDIPQNPQALTSVLMATLAGVDEVREIVSRLRGDQTRVTADAPLTTFPAIEPFRTLLPLRIVDLMLLMAGELKQNIRAIVKAMARKELIVV